MFTIYSYLILGLTSYCFCLSIPESPNVGIIGGHDISIEDVPYIASLRLNGTVHFCGCSIIHEQFVLTAAHCIVPNRKYKVLVGTDNVNKGGRLYDVEKILKHELYVNKTYDYDICILKLNETLTFGPKVNKIALNDNNVKLKKGMMFNTTGWGYTEPNGNISESVRQVKLPLVRWKSCRMSYGRMLKPITVRMICAGGNGRDSCQGDSGGPLTWNGVQVGITSFGAGCAVLPGVYTNVSKMLPWINDTIKNNL
ncbi:unnamed protein product [Arctia plantaginis]|uniref:trypsin n=1 Tax=Arctia plantaginis TaxID=874455 RepID=A0A8S1AKP2_ARCPL|nr:unnamed protein product [Arctia plantaginis]CAB3245882.1 unnamed protein product [Arctia plantaginis]